MEKSEIKRKIYNLAFNMVVIGLGVASYIHFYRSNNWTIDIKNQGEYYFQKGETKGLFTRRIFTKKEFEDDKSEAYYEYGLDRGKGYLDSHLDGAVDEIAFYDSRGRENFHWTRGEEIEYLILNKANQDFARNRKDFEKCLQK